MIFFTDENFADPAAALLQAFDRDNEIRAFLKHFPRGTPDIEWLQAIGNWEHKPVILGGDGRILRNRVERAALRDSGCSFVYLASGWTNTPWNTFCVKLIKYWPDVVEMTKKTQSQAVLELTTRGFLLRKPLPG